MAPRAAPGPFARRRPGARRRRADGAARRPGRDRCGEARITNAGGEALEALVFDDGDDNDDGF